jgi:hypothetical protein
MHAAISGKVEPTTEPLGTRLRNEALKRRLETRDSRNDECFQNVVRWITSKSAEFPDRTEFTLTRAEADACGDISSIVHRLAVEHIFCIPNTPPPPPGSGALVGRPPPPGSLTIYLGELPHDIARTTIGIALLRSSSGEDPKTGAALTGAPLYDKLRACDGAGLSDRSLDEVQALSAAQARALHQEIRTGEQAQAQALSEAQARSAARPGDRWPLPLRQEPHRQEIQTGEITDTDRVDYLDWLTTTDGYSEAELYAMLGAMARLVKTSGHTIRRVIDVRISENARGARHLTIDPHRRGGD